mmetsp:Transcript_3032/g.3202  ORF Transcript_3032/g.3202 Transcript_3032/m.3202 type:complete len:144 (+) Transcript_3032:234-665(+)
MYGSLTSDFMFEMMEMRNRGKGYHKVSTDEDIDDIPEPIMYRYNEKAPLKVFRKGVPKVKSTAGSICCFFFSLSGVVFLSSIAHILNSNSEFIKVGQENAHHKQKLVPGVIGAIIMYIICMAVSARYWYLAVHYVEDDARFLD